MTRQQQLAGIAYTSTGEGPVLVLVHGVGGRRSDWSTLERHLAAHFTLVCPDRPGRGDSADLFPWSLEAEFMRFCEFVDALAAPVRLFGHSLGGQCALEAMLACDNVLGAVLYEPSLAGTLHPGRPDLETSMTEALAHQDPDRVMEIFMSGVLGLSDQEVAVSRMMPGWAERCRLAPTVVREMLALRHDSTPAERYAGVHGPLHLLVGSETPSWLLEPTHRLKRAIPRATLRRLDGQGHLALSLAPRLLARAILEGGNARPGSAGTAQSGP